MPVIGLMSPQSAAGAARNLAAFRNGLRELGYIEGRNVRIEYRFAEGVAERFPILVAELVALNPAIILVGSVGASLAAHKVTRTIPLIMFAAAANPVALGLADSFARPGGNVTGFLTASDAGIVGKRLELLREAAPGFSRLGALVVPDDAVADGTLSALPSAARGLGLDLRVYDARSETELEPAFAAAQHDGMQALYVAQSPPLPGPASRDCRDDGTPAAAGDLFLQGVRASGRPDVIQRRFVRHVSSCRELCGQDFEGRQSRRAAAL